MNKVDLLVEKLTHRAALRLLTLPSSHPLYTHVKICSNRLVKRHRTPLHTLPWLYNLKSTKIEKIEPITTPPWTEININTLILNRDEAIQYHEECKADFHIFSDGSGYKNGIGAAAVMYKKREPLLASLTYHLGTSAEHTVHEGETVGLTLAGQLLEATKKPRGSLSVVFAVDNTSTITGTTSRNIKAAQSHMVHFRKQVERLVSKRKHSKIDITVAWVPGHEGVAGNEEADRLAKRAAEGKTSAKNFLPKPLHKPPLANKAAVKQHFLTQLKLRQEAAWNVSKRRTALAKVGFTKPNKIFPKLVKPLSRREAGLLIQMRLGHAPLNKHLHRIGKVVRPSCPACNAPEETVTHFVRDCPKYAFERLPLRQAAGRRDLLKYALSDKKGVKIFMEYIRQTERFERLEDESAGRGGGAAAIGDMTDSDEEDEG